MIRVVFILSIFFISTFGKSLAYENRIDPISYDGNWNWKFVLDKPNHTCSQLLEPGFLTIRNGRVSGEIPFVLGSYHISGHVNDLIIGMWDNDMPGENITIDVIFDGDSAFGRFSATLGGCEGSVKLKKEDLTKPNMENLSLEDRVKFLENLIRNRDQTR